MKVNKKRVLIFPASSEVGLEIFRGIKNSSHFETFGLHSGYKANHAKFVFENYIEGAPFANDESFIPYLNKIIIDYKIDVIFPANDNVIEILSNNANDIKCKTILPKKETAIICNSKKLTYEALKNKGINIPEIFNINDVIVNTKLFPIFVKPNKGSGSIGAEKIISLKDLDIYQNKYNDFLISEYLDGPEYTIDCFTDKNGRLLACAGRERIRVYQGASVNSIHIHNEKFKIIATIINKHLHFNGPWFFQLKEKKQELYLLEVGARIAGGMHLTRYIGLNLVLLSLFNIFETDLSICYNEYLNVTSDRALYAKYELNYDYEKIFVDFDDTMIVNDKVNTDLLFFLYENINKNKKIILITKHKNNIYKTLKKYKLSENMFEQIYHLEKEDDKSKYIDTKKAIFIDDSFYERKNIYEKCNIPVFDTHSFVL